MAQPATVRFGKFRIKLETAPGSGIYAAPCGFTSKSLTLTKALTEITLPDCDDPDAVAWIGRDAESLSAQVSGEGVLASESVETWLDAWESEESINSRLEIEFPTKTIVWAGKMHVASLNPSAEQGGRVTMSVEMQSDGELVRTVGP